MLHRVGYTLPEVLMVLVIIGLLGALTIPRMSSVRMTYVLDQAAQQLQADLRRAQTEAVRQNQMIDITRPTDSTYVIEAIGIRRLPWPVKFATATVTAMQLQTFGPPVGGAKTFVVTLGGRKRTITVNAVGRIGVSVEEAQ